MVVAQTREAVKPQLPTTVKRTPICTQGVRQKRQVNGNGHGAMHSHSAVPMLQRHVGHASTSPRRLPLLLPQTPHASFACCTALSAACRAACVALPFSGPTWRTRRTTLPGRRPAWGGDRVRESQGKRRQWNGKESQSKGDAVAWGEPPPAHRGLRGPRCQQCTTSY